MQSGVLSHYCTRQEQEQLLCYVDLNSGPVHSNYAVCKYCYKKGIPCFRLLIVLSIIHFVVDGKYGHVWLYAHVFYDAPFVKL